MFRWASNTLESLAQTVAPPPTDPLSRLYFAGQKRDEPAIMEILQQQQQHEGIAIHPVHTIIHEVKGYTLLHLACLYSLSGLLQYCVHQMQQESPHPSYYLLVTDKEGNTPLHCAAMSNHGDALEIIKRLLSIEVEASSSSQNGSNTGNNTPPMITVQNGLRKTPYDVATVNSIRQYLLPIQLQAETQIALQNGGVGLPPGIDMGGLTIQNAAHLPPPPTSFGSGALPAAGRVSSHGGGGSMYAPIPGLNVSSTDPSVATALPVPTTPSVMPQQPPQQEQQMYHSNVDGQFTSPLVDGNNTATAPPSNQQTGVPLPPMPVRQETQPRHLSSSSSTNEMTTPPSTIPRPPNSNGSLTGSTSSYALTGRSSAAIFSKSSKGGIQPDGFHSSSSDKNLQEKYGHVNVSNTALPPPPSSGNFTTPENISQQQQQQQYPQPLSAPPSMSGGGVNPFAGGLAATTTGAFRTSARRYVTYDPTASQRPSPLPPQQQQQQQQAASMYNQFQQPIPAQPPAQPFNPVFNGNNFPVPTQSSSVSFTIPPAPFSGSNTGGANTFSSPNSFIGKTPANTPMLSSLNTTTGITPSATTTFMSPPPSGMAASFGATTEPATVAPQSFASSSSPDRSGSGSSVTSNTAASVFGSPTTGVSVAPSAPTDRRTQSSHGYHRSNSGDAAALFSKPITTTETAMDSTPIPPPEPQEQSATHTDTTTDTINATGFTEDDDLHDVPLTPGQEATYKVNAVENDTNQPLPGNDQPPPPLTDAVNSLITAIGMPPPPFSRK